jgi:hypothetical protein
MSQGEPNRLDRQEGRTQAEGTDRITIYQALLRILVHLEHKDYTQKEVRQADVWAHDDPPDPASARDNSQG